MSVLKKGRLVYTDPGGKKKAQSYDCELWDNKVIDLTGLGKYGGVKKSINLVRCHQLEPDNYTSTRFTVKILGGYSHDLQAKDENDRTGWIDCICDVCGISNPLTVIVPRQKKALPPLPPPKPVSEERRREEEKGIYEDMSDEDEEEYIAPTSMGQQDPDEGGVLEYHYPSVDRRIRPASFHDDGAPVTSSSGGGMFDHDEEDDDEYIDPTIPAASMRQLPQAPDGGHGYMNTNTLDGKDLKSTSFAQNIQKSFTLPQRSPSTKVRAPTHHVTARKPLTPPSSRKKMPIQPPSSETGGASNELLKKLKKRKDKVDEVGDDAVFEPNRHSPPPPVHSKPVYQNYGLDKPPTVPAKATSPKLPSRSDKFSGSKSRSDSSFEDSSGPDWKRSQLPVQDPPWLKQKKECKPSLPEQDPPWLKQKKDSKPSLPEQDPPWLEQKKASKEGRLDRSYPIPTETAPSRQNERRFDKPFPLPTETAPTQPRDRRFDKAFPLPTETTPPHSSDRRFDKPFPLPSETQQPSRGKGKWRESEGDSPPPLPPGRTSSKRDMFEPSSTDRIPSTSSRKPMPPPPTVRKPVREVQDDFDFPTAEQLRSKGNRASQPFSHSQPPLPPRGSSDPRCIDNRPPLAPPKPSYR